MYNPSSYTDPLRRRFQQPQADMQAPTFQRPQPMMGQPAPAGPQMPMQWVQGVGGEQQGGQMNLGGIGELLKRFRKPQDSGPEGARAAFEAGGSL